MLAEAIEAQLNKIDETNKDKKAAIQSEETDETGDAECIMS